MASRVLVLGATGMLGHAAVGVLADSFDVVASVRDVERARCHGLPADLVEFDARTDPVAHLIDRLRPDAVLNAIGVVKQLPEGNSPTAAIRLNALFPHEVAEACAPSGTRLIHISTDCVFSGRLPAPARYSEDDTPDASDMYGRSKLLGEVAHPPGLTLRTSIVGRELDRASGLMEWFAGREGERVHGFRQAWFSGLTTIELSRIVARLLHERAELTGLWHVAGEPIDKYTLLLKFREILEVDCEIMPRDEPVINRALDGARFETATGYRPPSWDEMLKEYVIGSHG